MWIRWAVGALCLIALGACAEGERTGADRPEPLSSPSPSPSRSMASPSSGEAPSTPPLTEPCLSDHPTPREDRVLVFFACDKDDRYPPVLYAFARPVNVSADLGQRLHVAVAEYFKGPTPAEGREFYGFGPEDRLNGVDVRGTTAIIDVNLNDGYGSTAAQLGFVWASLRALAFQFPEIEFMEPRHNGSCEAFGNIVQAAECSLAKRDGTYVAG